MGIVAVWVVDVPSQRNRLPERLVTAESGGTPRACTVRREPLPILDRADAS